MPKTIKFRNLRGEDPNAVTGRARLRDDGTIEGQPGWVVRLIQNPAGPSYKPYVKPTEGLKYLQAIVDQYENSTGGFAEWDEDESWDDSWDGSWRFDEVEAHSRRR